MPALHPLSQFALSETENVTFIPESLRRLAFARTVDPIVFLEISARENVVTTLTDVLKSPEGTFINPLSSLATSSRFLPRTERQTRTFLFSTRPWCGLSTDENRPYQRALPRLLSGGRITRSRPIESTTRRRGQRTIGDASISNPDGALDYLLTDFTLSGGSIKAWLGQPNDSSSEWALLYEGTIRDVQATRKDIRISITTISDQLERSLQLRRYSGSGGFNGDASVAGRLRPTSWGECFGCDPVLMDASNRVYQVHDGPMQSIDAVMEGGLPYDFTADYSSYDDLINATLASGEYATALNLGCFRIGTTLEGLVYPIRVNLKGDARGNGYVSSTGDILYRIARDRAFLQASSLDVDAFQGLPRGRVGYYVNGSQDVTVSSVFDDLLRGVVATYGVGRRAVLSVKRMLPAEFLLDDITIAGEQVFDFRVEERPFIARIAQPFIYAPTFAPVSSDDLSSEVDASTEARLTSSGLTGEVVQESNSAVPVTPQPALQTYFVTLESAQDVALDALLFSSRNLVPLRAEVGRAGILVDIGGVLAINNLRFAEDFRGVVYEQEDNLGAVITSRVVALG